MPGHCHMEIRIEIEFLVFCSLLEDRKQIHYRYSILLTPICKKSLRSLEIKQMLVDASGIEEFSPQLRINLNMVREEYEEKGNMACIENLLEFRKRPLS